MHALDEGETLIETFTYTLSDGELTDTANLVVTIVGVNDPPTITLQVPDDSVDESGLPDGSAPSATAILASGTFTIADIDGLDDIQSIT